MNIGFILGLTMGVTAAGLAAGAEDYLARLQVRVTDETGAPMARARSP